jgi:predicted dehydrogenase
MLQREKPDFVDIITPPATHLDLCRVAADYGVDIICQKPLAPTYDQTLQLAEIVRRAKGRFMVHENWRWQPWYRRIKQLLAEGTLGEFFHIAVQTRMGDGWGRDAYLARQPFFRDYPRLFIFETGVHFLDTFRFLFGEISSVYARVARRNPVIKGEDSALLLCQFAGGGTAVLDASRYNECEAADPRYTFGRLRIDASKGHIEMNEEGVIRVKLLGQPAFDIDYAPSRHGFTGDSVHAVQRHFVDCVLGGKSFESTLDDYLKTVRLVEAGYQSAATNRVIPVQD